MMKKTILLLFLLVSAFAKAQVEYRELTSEKLGSTRQIKVQLPRNYSANTEKNYPVIIVMDGDYLFEPVAGNVDYYSYWEEMPDALVVGILQGDTREDDTFYDDVNFLPDDTGAAFFEFVGLELMPYLDANYRTANFRIAVGHDLTANFINFYLMKEPALFQGYISISPDLSPMMEERLVTRLGAVEQKVFYYLATATEDLKVLREPINALSGQLKTLSNPMVKTYFDNFEEATHYSLVGRAIPQALEDIFSISRPISKKEYKETILNLPGSPYDYLVEKYAVVKELFGLDEKIRVNDFIATSTALEKRSDWEGMENLGKLARQQYPDTMLGSYYLALAMENTGSPKKAMKTYQNGFLMEEVAFITKDLMLDKAAKIKEDFGY